MKTSSLLTLLAGLESLCSFSVKMQLLLMQGVPLEAAAWDECLVDDGSWDGTHLTQCSGSAPLTADLAPVAGSSGALISTWKRKDRGISSIKLVH